MTQNCFGPSDDLEDDLDDLDDEFDSIEDECSEMTSAHLSNVPVRQCMSPELQQLLQNQSDNNDNRSSRNGISNVNSNNSNNNNSSPNLVSNSNGNSSNKSNDNTNENQEQYSIDKHLDTWDVDDEDGGWGYEIDGSQYVIKMDNKQRAAKMQEMKREIDSWQQQTITSGDTYGSQELIKYLKSLVYLILTNVVVGELARHDCAKAAKVAKIKGRTPDAIFNRLKRLSSTENKTENATLLKLYEYVIELLKHQNILNRASSS